VRRRRRDLPTLELAPLTDEALHAAADDLIDRLRRSDPDVRAARRLLAAPQHPGGQR
jgi:hypothetical protein